MSQSETFASRGAELISLLATLEGKIDRTPSAELTGLVTEINEHCRSALDLQPGEIAGAKAGLQEMASHLARLEKELTERIAGLAEESAAEVQSPPIAQS